MGRARDPCGSVKQHGVLSSLWSAILDNIGEGLVCINGERKITSIFNKAIEKMTGLSARQALGMPCFEVLRSSLCETGCPFPKVISGGDPVYDTGCTLKDPKGRELKVSVSLIPVLDDEGRIAQVLEIVRDLSAVSILREALAGRFRLASMVSKSPRMQEIFEILPDIAQSDSTVLIEGPTGSGKEVMAAAIHELSLRRNGPFLKVNCAAIPDTLLESELFGYIKGAFTDAKRDKPGRFVLAHGGTMFLDEVGDMSPALQVKLLRVLEERQILPLGGTSPVRVDVRIIAATNRPLEELVHAGRFRDDLYYRLNIIKIQLPSLRERREDIPLLIDHFIGRLNSLKGKRILGVSPRVMEILMNYEYPGNIRELENILEHSYVLCRGKIIDEAHLPKEILLQVSASRDLKATKASPRELEEAMRIRQALEAHNGKKILAAKELGVSRVTLWRRMRRMGIR